MGRAVEDFSGAAALTGSVASATAGSPIVITEITDEAEDQFELQNVAAKLVDMTGWSIIIGDSTSDVSARNKATYMLPAAMAAGALLRVSESGAAGRVYFGNSINWSGTETSKGWIMLFDDTSTLGNDGDGMPDVWETAHGLAGGDPTDATLDPDWDRSAPVLTSGSGRPPPSDWRRRLAPSRQRSPAGARTASSGALRSPHRSRRRINS